MVIAPTVDRFPTPPVHVAAGGDLDLAVPPLPESVTSFVGREREVAAVCAMLRHGDVRLLTLTGPGGVGKTRLALAAARELAPDFPDGVAFVPLARVADPELVVPTIAQALDIREGGERPVGQRLARALHGRRLLLVLDNFEQVIAAAPDLVALLAASAHLKILTTSRSVLEVSGEHAFPTPPLALPDPEAAATVPELAATEAVRLFVERAQAVRPGFALDADNAAAVVAICQLLDRLPLGIELAAARVRLLNPPDLVARLDPLPSGGAPASGAEDGRATLGSPFRLLGGGGRDQPARLRGLREAIAWSYDLLDDVERALFRRLAVFAGGFTMEATAAVCGVADDLELLEGVGSLVAKSLVQQTEPAAGGRGAGPRYEMLETIRQYGLERLDASGRAATVRNAHARWCLELAEAVGPGVRTGQQAASTARLDVEHGNLRAALAWLLETGAVDDALRLGDALRIFWHVRGHAGEGLRWLERALAAEPAGASTIRAKALFAAAHLAHHRGDDDRASEHLAACLECYRALGDRPGQAFPLHVLGMIAEDRGDYARAAALLEEARALFLTAGNGPYAANALYHLGIAAYGQGALDLAIERYEAAFVEARNAGDAYTAAAALSYLGLARCDRGEEVAAVEAVAESLTLYRASNNLIGLARGLAHLAVIAQTGREPSAAARLFGAFDTLTERVGYGFAHPEVDRYERSRAALRAEMGEAAYATATADGRVLRLEAALDEAESIGGLIGTKPRRSEDSTSRIPAPFGLTPREVEVLALVARGLTDAAVADELSISPRTVGQHLRSIYNKLDVSSRAAATRFAIEHSLG